MSLTELAWRLDLYNRSEETSPEFAIFLDHCYKRFLTNVTEIGWWTMTENGSYTAGTSNKRKIRKAMHRFIHRLIIFSINQKKEGDCVLNLMYYLCGVSLHQMYYVTSLIVLRTF